MQVSVIANGDYQFDCCVCVTETGQTVAEIEIHSLISAKLTRERFPKDGLVLINGVAFDCDGSGEMFARGRDLFMHVFVSRVQLEYLTD